MSDCDYLRMKEEKRCRRYFNNSEVIRILNEKNHKNLIVSAYVFIIRRNAQLHLFQYSIIIHQTTLLSK